MTIEVKHATQAVGTDAGNGEIRKTQWNEAHTINLAGSRLLGRYSSTAGAAQEISLGTGFTLNPSTGEVTFTESDPVFTAHVAYAITSTNISNWNSAYGWGNHASAGYLTSAAIGVSVQAYDADLTSWAAIAPSAKQDALVSGTNIKTINGTSVLGSGDLTISGGGSALPVSDEGTQITAGATSINFTGSGVTATASGNAVTVDIPAASGGGSSTLTISNKTAAYTVVAGDLGTVINCTSGTFTVSLTAAATLGSGFNCVIWNLSETLSDVITIDPAGTETIDGRTTLLLRRGEGTQIICNGTNWQTGDKKTMRGYAENYTASATRPVATGSNAISLGNAYASGTDSFAASIANNTSSYGALGTGAIALGETAKATSTYSIAIGPFATASVSSSSAIGLRATADETDSFALGNWSRTIAKGKFAFASFQLGGAAGNTQAGKIILANSTTNATATVLVSTGSGSATNTNQVLLSNNSAYAFSGIIIARQSAAGGTASAAWKVEGLIRREANAGTTTLVASTVTAISNVPGWTLALSADTTNGCLAVTATGAAATNIRWVANIDTAELVYA